MNFSNYMRKSYKAFTLVEMLIVMGIIIILMAVGIASGRYAIQRANKIEHQNAAENIFEAVQSYYIENREYPGKDDVPNTSPLILLEGEAGVGPYLEEYIDDFEGGSEASFIYVTEPTGQEALICVTYGGFSDENQLGIYCTGNGVGGDLITDAPTRNDLDYGEEEYNLANNFFHDGNCSNWQPNIKGWGIEGCQIGNLYPG